MADVFATDAPRSARRSSAPAVRATRTPTSSKPVAPVSEIRTAPAAPAAATVPGGVVLTRAEVDSALADFAKLTRAMRGSFTASGVMVEGVADGTIFARAGLRTGDLIIAVDGTQLRSLDDAANLYARASSAKAMSAKIIRNGTPRTLHVVIQ
jgi:general secretion pathway protein C